MIRDILVNSIIGIRDDIRRRRKGIAVIALFAAGIVVLCAGTVTINVLGLRQVRHAESRGNDVYSSVLRFHVLANSDSAEDQQVKLKVKDVLAKELAKDMKAAGVATKEQAYEYVDKNMNKYVSEASLVLRNEGYDYGVKGELSNCWFPVKMYGSKVFPAGNYDAFRILIGKAEGKNWWCVLFPSLCMVDETYMVVDEHNDMTDNNESVSSDISDENGGTAESGIEKGMERRIENGEENGIDNAEEDKQNVRFRLGIVEWLSNIW